MTVSKKRKQVVPIRSTLDQKHTERLEYLDNLQKSLPQKKSQLELLEHELDEINELSRSNIKSIRKKVQLIDHIKNLKEEIANIENGNESLDYISGVLPDLVNYYDDSIVDGDDDSPEEELNTNNVMYYFTRSKTKTQAKIRSSRPTKTKIYESYMSTIDPVHRMNNMPVKSNNCEMPDCNGSKMVITNDSSLVCDKCGHSEKIFIAADKPKFKEFNQDCAYAYKRINHLTEILSQLQAQESTDIPSTVFTQINNELKKRKIRKENLDIFWLRRILKRLGLRKYYEHVPHILQILNGKEPPNFSRHDVMKIKQKFKEIQKPFSLFRPPNRKNFLNYSYVIRKICELIGLRSHVNYFPLLKNINKLREHDSIWKKICTYLRWPFIKSS